MPSSSSDSEANPNSPASQASSSSSNMDERLGPPGYGYAAFSLVSGIQAGKQALEKSVAAVGGLVKRESGSDEEDRILRENAVSPDFSLGPTNRQPHASSFPTSSQTALSASTQIPGQVTSFARQNVPQQGSSGLFTTPTAKSLPSIRIDPETRRTLVDVGPNGARNLPLQISGIPLSGAKSRVETQVKLNISVSFPLSGPQPTSTPANQATLGFLSTYTHLKLQKGVATKRRSKKDAEGMRDVDPREEQVLHLHTEVYCATEGADNGGPNGKGLGLRVFACQNCRAREVKRSQRKLAARVRPTLSDSELDSTSTTPANRSPNGTNGQDERQKIVLFNCAPLLDFSQGETQLPARVTCYCRHHREKVGFVIKFILKNHLNEIVASGLTPPIMITDDHKATSSSIAAAKAAAAAASTPGVTPNIESAASRTNRMPKAMIMPSNPTSNASIRGVRRPSRPNKRHSISASASVDGDEDDIQSIGHHHQHHHRRKSATPYDRRPSPSSAGSSVYGTPRTTTSQQLLMTPIGRPGTLSSSTAHSPVDVSGLGDLRIENIHSDNQTFSGTSTAEASSSETTPPVSMFGESVPLDPGELVGAMVRQAEVGRLEVDPMNVEDEFDRYTSSLHSVKPDDGQDDIHDMSVEVAFDSLVDYDGPVAPHLAANGGLGLNAEPVAGWSTPTEEEQLSFESMFTLPLSPPGSSIVPAQPIDLPSPTLYTGPIELDESGSSGSVSDHGRLNRLIPNPFWPDIGSSSSSAAGTSSIFPLQQQEPQQQMQMQLPESNISLGQPYSASLLPLLSPPPPPAPMITRLIPGEGPMHGGIEVTILGANFVHGLTCMFGDTASSKTTLWGESAMVCLLPPSAAPGPVVVRFRRESENEVDERGSQMSLQLFTYLDTSDRALMELALQVVGLKMTGRIEDAKNVALRIVGQAPSAGSEPSQSHNAVSSNGQQHAGSSTTTRQARDASTSENITSRWEAAANAVGGGNFQDTVLKFLDLIDLDLSPEIDNVDNANSISLRNRHGHSLLHLAVLLGFHRLVARLIALGSDLDVRDKNGYTPLALGALSARIACSRLLIEAGADMEIVTAEGKRPVDIARERDQIDVVDLLTRASRQQLANRDHPSSADGSDDEGEYESGHLDDDNPSTGNDSSDDGDFVHRHQHRHRQELAALSSDQVAASAVGADAFPDSDGLTGDEQETADSTGVDPSIAKTRPPSRMPFMESWVKRKFPNLPNLANLNLPQQRFPHLPSVAHLADLSSTLAFPANFFPASPLPAHFPALRGREKTAGREKIDEKAVSSTGDQQHAWDHYTAAYPWLPYAISAWLKEMSSGSAPPPAYQSSEEGSALIDVKDVKSSSASTTQLAGPSTSTLSSRHQVGYELKAASPADHIKAYGHRTASRRKVKQDRMIWFWLSLLVVVPCYYFFSFLPIVLTGVRKVGGKLLPFGGLVG